jgi:hypothetical protein
VSLVVPHKWSQLPQDRFVLVQWPHPESFSNPEHYGELIYRDGVITERTKNGVMVRLDSGGSVEIRNMAALKIDQSDEEAKKNSRRRAGA